MKLLTVTVPCYNSQDYMEKCIESLLRGGERVEIIVIDDGSKDATGEIGDRYAAEYPGIVRVIHQENGGHGAGINAGLKTVWVNPNHLPCGEIKPDYEIEYLSQLESLLEGL